jgi:hypothetical protein
MRAMFGEDLNAPPISSGTTTSCLVCGTVSPRGVFSVGANCACSLPRPQGARANVRHRRHAWRGTQSGICIGFRNAG